MIHWDWIITYAVALFLKQILSSFFWVFTEFAMPFLKPLMGSFVRSTLETEVPGATSNPMVASVLDNVYGEEKSASD
jgi:hypothetical protein